MPTRTLPFFARFNFKSGFILFAAFLAACDGQLAGIDGSKDGISNPDTLNAELGRNHLNRYEFLQGKFLATGQSMDLAIEGKGLFILKNQAQYVYFRRPAMFGQDAEGYLHLGNTRTRLQGIRLYSDQEPYPLVPSDSAPRAGLPDLSDVRWPFDDLAPPRATTVVKLGRNLDSDAYGKGSVLATQAFLHHAEPVDLLIGLVGSDGSSLGIRAGDVLTLSATALTSAHTAEFTVTAQSTLADLADAMTAFLSSAPVGGGLATSVDAIAPADHAGLRGALTLYGNTAPIRSFQVTSNRPVSGPRVTRAFALPLEIPPGSVRMAITTETLRSPAIASDPIAEVYDASGNGFGLEPGDRISFSGAIGDDQAQSVSPIVYATGTTLGSILDKVRENFKLAEYDGTRANHPSVSLNPAGSDDNIRDGAVVIRGAPGTESAIKDVSIRSTDNNNSKPSPNFFNTNLNITTLRDATDHAIGTCSLEVFDAGGKAHRLSLRFLPTNAPEYWRFEIGLEDGTTLIGPSGGNFRFGADGSVSESAIKHLTFRPGNDAAPILLALDFTGLTHFRSVNTVAPVSQDGFPAGRLLTVSIGEEGIITGTYSNGQSRALFQLPLADFPNRNGLMQVGENSFLESPESGKAAVSVGLDPRGGAIRSGAIEYVTDAERARVCELFPGC